MILSAFGWAGITLVLIAFMGVTASWWGPHDTVYQWLNLGGAAGILIETFSRRDFPPAVLNLVWAVVALLGLIGVLK